MSLLKKISEHLRSRMPSASLFFFPRKSDYLLSKGLYIDPVFFKTGLQDRYLLGFSLKTVKVSKLTRKIGHRTYSLDELPLYRYLNARQHGDKSKPNFEKLIQNIEANGFDPKSCIICKYRSNAIKDGQHRATYLLWKHGPDYTINVLHVRVKKDLLRFRICPWLKTLV